MKQIIVGLSILAVSILALGCDSGTNGPASGDASKQGKAAAPRKKTDL